VGNLMAQFKFTAGIPVQFGALTLAGDGDLTLPAGAASITSAGGTNLSVSGGVVVPSTNGVTSGTVVFNNGAVWVVTAVPDTYSAAKASDIDALVALGATLSGKTVKLRPGTYTALGNYNGLQASYTSQVTFEAEDPTDKPQLLGWTFSGSTSSTTRGRTTLRNIRFEVDARGGSGEQNIINLGASGTDRCTDIIIDQCDFVGNLGVWSDVNGAPSAEWGCINCLRCDNLTVTDCTMTGLVNFVAFLCGSGHEISGNLVTGHWGDFLRIGPTIDGAGDSANIVIKDNIVYDYAGNYDDYRHCDFIQGFDRGNTGSGGSVTDVQVLRNIVFFGTTQLPASNGSKNQIQFMLMQPLANTVDSSNLPLASHGYYKRWTVRGNVAELNSTHGVTWETRCDDSVIEGNTFIPSRRCSDNGVAISRPLIQGWMTDCTVRQNVCDGGVNASSGINGVLVSQGAASSGNTIEDNYTTTINVTSDTALAALFQGTTFKPDTPAELLSMLLMKPNGALDADASGGPTVGDIGALGTTTSNGIADFVNRTINTALIG
jgi:hypothetical protein